MKQIFRSMFGILLVAVLVFTATSCEEYLDVNKDPNNATDATRDLILSAAINSTSATVGSWYQILGGMWSQFWTQNNASNQYKRIDYYNLNHTDFDAFFRESYAGALNDYERVRTKSMEAEDWNYYLIATVMQAYQYQLMADLYGQIPFTEALQATEGLVNPNPDAGALIYDSLIARIDAALAKDLDAETCTDPGQYDFIFAGDMTSWVAFANTLKLRMYMRMSEADAAKAQAGIAAMYTAGATFLTTDAKMDYTSPEATKQNPLYECDREALNTDQNIKASRTMVSFLKANADPRINVFYEAPADGSGVIEGLLQGNAEVPSTEVDPESISRVRINANDPVYFITAAESYFLQAEAALYGWGTGNAKSLYDMGVQAAFSRVGLDGSSFVAGGGAYEYPAGTEAENLEAIIVQKWAGLAGANNMQAYFDHLRTGYPKRSAVDGDDASYVAGQLTDPVNTVLGPGLYPKRLLYPESELNRNASITSSTAVYAKKITDPVWWDVD